MSARNVGLVLGKLWRNIFGGPKPSQVCIVPKQVQKSLDTHFLLPGTEVESKWRLPAIPAGYQIFDARIEVAGLSYRRDEALRFIRSTAEHKIEFESDSTNEHDANAIKVIGIADANRYHLGFLPAYIAKQLAVTGLADKVIARLERAYAGNNDYVSVIIQVVGPKQLVKTYRRVID